MRSWYKQEINNLTIGTCLIKNFNQDSIREDVVMDADTSTFFVI